MAIRISLFANEGQTIVKVDGRLSQADLEALRQACKSATGRAVLDLTDLLSVDRDAIVTLRELVSLGVEVRSATPYIQLLLNRTSGRK